MQINAIKRKNKKEELMSNDEMIDMVFETAKNASHLLAYFHWFLMMEIES